MHFSKVMIALYFLVPCIRLVPSIALSATQVSFLIAFMVERFLRNLLVYLQTLNFYFIFFKRVGACSLGTRTLAMTMLYAPPQGFSSSLRQSSLKQDALLFLTATFSSVPLALKISQSVSWFIVPIPLWYYRLALLQAIRSCSISLLNRSQVITTSILFSLQRK